MEEGKDIKSIKSESPTVRAILDGRSEIQFIGEGGGSTKTRSINGTDWVGREYTYSINIPAEGTALGKPWSTELTVWFADMRNPWKIPPETQLYIMTGKGEMQFTSDPEVKNAVIDEINRQMNLARKESSSSK